MKRKMFLVVSLLILFSMVLSACGPKATEALPAAPAGEEGYPASTPEAETAYPAASEPPAATEGEMVELTLGSWRVDDVDAWTLITEAFNARYPNITVKFDPTNPPDYNATLRTQLETGTGPDLFFVRSFATGLELYEAGYIANLKDLPGLKDNYTEAIRSPWAVDADNPYAVPIIAVSHGVYYNEQIFQDNGIELPKTWEELMAAAQKLKDAGITPFANGTKDAWDINEVVMMQLIPSDIGGYDGRMAYLNGERCFNDADLVEAYQRILDMQPYLPEGFEGISYYDSQQLFAQGQAAMMLDGSWSVPGFQKDATDFPWSVFYAPAPEGKDLYVTFHIDAAVGANANGKHLPEAMLFLEWLESKEFGELLGNNLPGFFPLVKDAPALTDPVAQTFMGFNTEAKGTDIRFVWEKLLAAPSGQKDAYTAMNEGVIAVLKGELTPQQAADALQEALAGWYEPAMGCPK